jgi:hypothetical protein
VIGNVAALDETFHDERSDVSSCTCNEIDHGVFLEDL